MGLQSATCGRRFPGCVLSSACPSGLLAVMMLLLTFCLCHHPVVGEASSWTDCAFRAKVKNKIMASINAMNVEINMGR